MSLGLPSRRIAVITGANRGLGFETAFALAKRNFKVIMADKADQKISQEILVKKTCNEHILTEFLDLASFESVRNFANNIFKIVNRLDVLVNNAGVFCMDKQRTVDGLDAVMQINHLGPFLLTNLLAELLKKSAGSRIIFVSSTGSFFHNLNIENLKEPDYYYPHFLSGAIHYYNTKLCNMISTKGFAEKLGDCNITSNCLHPGMVNTNFLISSDSLMNISPDWRTRTKKRILKCVTRHVQDAAGMLVFLATSDTVKCTSGKYFVNYLVHQEPAIVRDAMFCRGIWNMSEELVGLRRNSNGIC